MQLRTELRALAVLIAIAGCSTSSTPVEDAINLDSGAPDSDPGITEIDPGMPAVEFGTKCYLELVEEASNTKIAIEDCTVLATSTDRISQVYLWFRRLPAASQRMYVSLVLGTTPLAPAMHASARGGAIETTLTDGRIFSTADVRKEGSFQLTIEQAGPANEAADHYYVTGMLEATLVDHQDTSSKVRLKCWMSRQ
jgi:hypothetical protein